MGQRHRLREALMEAGHGTQGGQATRQLSRLGRPRFRANVTVRRRHTAAHVQFDASTGAGTEA